MAIDRHSRRARVPFLLLAAAAVAACGDSSSNEAARCGTATCPSQTVCCDHCAGTCVPETSGAACPDDLDPERTCDDSSDSGELVCGDGACEGPSEYCSELVGGPVGSPVEYECLPIPAECTGGAITCACFEPGAGCDCEVEAAGIRLTCYAP